MPTARSQRPGNSDGPCAARHHGFDGQPLACLPHEQVAEEGIGPPDGGSHGAKGGGAEASPSAGAEWGCAHAEHRRPVPWSVVGASGDALIRRWRAWRARFPLGRLPDRGQRPTAAPQIRGPGRRRQRRREPSAALRTARRANGAARAVVDPVPLGDAPTAVAWAHRLASCTHRHSDAMRCLGLYRIVPAGQSTVASAGCASTAGAALWKGLRSPFRWHPLRVREWPPHWQTLQQLPELVALCGMATRGQPLLVVASNRVAERTQDACPGHHSTHSSMKSTAQPPEGGACIALYRIGGWGYGACCRAMPASDSVAVLLLRNMCQPMDAAGHPLSSAVRIIGPHAVKQIAARVLRKAHSMRLTRPCTAEAAVVRCREPRAWKAEWGLAQDRRVFPNDRFRPRDLWVGFRAVDRTCGLASAPAESLRPT